MPAASNATSTIIPTTNPLLLRETGATGTGVEVAVAVGEAGSVGVEVGMPNVAVDSGGVGVAVSGIGRNTNIFWPSNISSVAKPFRSLICSTVVPYARAILHNPSFFLTTW